MPTLDCPDADSQHIAAFVILPPQSTVPEIKTESAMELCRSDTLEILLTSALPNQTGEGLARHFRPFVSRWKTATIRSPQAVSIRPVVRHSGITIKLRNSQFDSSQTILWAILWAGFWWWLRDRMKNRLLIPAVVSRVSPLLSYFCPRSGLFT